jgi:hypothetical protein
MECENNAAHSSKRKHEEDDKNTEQMVGAGAYLKRQRVFADVQSITPSPKALYNNAWLLISNDRFDRALRHCTPRELGATIKANNKNVHAVGMEKVLASNASGKQEDMVLIYIQGKAKAAQFTHASIVKRLKKVRNLKTDYKLGHLDAQLRPTEQMISISDEQVEQRVWGGTAQQYDISELLDTPTEALTLAKARKTVTTLKQILQTCNEQSQMKDAEIVQLQDTIKNGVGGRVQAELFYNLLKKRNNRKEQLLSENAHMLSDGTLVGKSTATAEDQLKELCRSQADLWLKQWVDTEIGGEMKDLFITAWRLRTCQHSGLADEKLLTCDKGIIREYYQSRPDYSAPTNTELAMFDDEDECFSSADLEELYFENVDSLLENAAAEAEKTAAVELEAEKALAAGVDAERAAAVESEQAANAAAGESNADAEQAAEVENVAAADAEKAAEVEKVTAAVAQKAAEVEKVAVAEIEAEMVAAIEAEKVDAEKVGADTDAEKAAAVEKSAIAESEVEKAAEIEKAAAAEASVGKAAKPEIKTAAEVVMAATEKADAEKTVSAKADGDAEAEVADEVEKAAAAIVEVNADKAAATESDKAAAVAKKAAELETAANVADTEKATAAAEVEKAAIADAEKAAIADAEKAAIADAEEAGADAEAKKAAAGEFEAEAAFGEGKTETEKAAAGATAEKDAEKGAEAAAKSSLRIWYE